MPLRERASLGARRRGAAYAVAFGVVLVGCGGAAGDRGTPALSTGNPPGEGGQLTWAVADRIRSVDPLTASTRAEQLASRQVHEPLTAVAASPFDPAREVAGLARRSRSSGDQTIWTFRLRPGVVFQDGRPFNSAAVRVNALRWRTTADGRALLPGLVAVASPRPNIVQFVLSAPDPDLPERLASPRLGIVSPDALTPSTGEGAVLARPSQTGTGPFEIFGRDATGRVLAPSPTWWGATAELELGPALDGIEFRTESSPALRLALLDAGEAQLADELGREQANLAAEDPLLTILRGDETSWLGLERSVRGIESAVEIPSLASAWLTDVATAG